MVLLLVVLLCLGGSNLQKIVALSTTEVKYIAVMEAVNEMFYLQYFLEELGKKVEKGIFYG